MYLWVYWLAKITAATALGSDAKFSLSACKIPGQAPCMRKYAIQVLNDFSESFILGSLKYALMYVQDNIHHNENCINLGVC